MRKIILSTILIIAVLSVGIFFLFKEQILDSPRYFAEKLTNENTKEFFNNSVKIKSLKIDKEFKLHIEGVSAELKTHQAPIPIVIRSIDSLDPLWFFLKNLPIRFRFDGLKTKSSQSEGVFGNAIVENIQKPNISAAADFSKTDLSDWQWLDPGNLDGAKGAIRGQFSFRQVFGDEPTFSLSLDAPSPGGDLQARLFDFFLPYLPTPAEKEKVRRLAEKNQLVHFEHANLSIDVSQSDITKIFLKIFVPDYNLQLNLSVEIRLDAKNALSQIANLLGLIEVK